MFIENYQPLRSRPAKVTAPGSMIDFHSFWTPPPQTRMSIAADKLEIIRQQVQYHLDHEEQKQLSPAREAELRERIKARLVQENAVIVAHYYTAPAIQALAEETGGCVSDSLEMARFGHDHPAQTLIVAGVKFMGETAKILTPDKRVLMPTLEATCSLDLGCPIEEFSAF